MSWTYVFRLDPRISAMALIFALSCFVSSNTYGETAAPVQPEAEKRPAQEAVQKADLQPKAGKPEIHSTDSKNAAATQITSVTVDSSDKDCLKVLIAEDGLSPQPKYFVLDSPPRLVVDLNAIKSPYPQKTMNVESAFLKKIRLAERKGGTRIVFDAKKTRIFPFSIEVTDKGLLVLIGKKKDGSKQSFAKIEAIDFETLEDNKALVRIVAEQKPEYHVRKIKKNLLQISLKNFLLPSSLAKTCDTGYFKGAVERITPQQLSKGKVIIKIKLRDDVPFKVTEIEKGIEIQFAASSAAPLPDRISRLSNKAEINVPSAKESGDEGMALPPEFAELAKSAGRDGANPRAEKVYTGQKISLDFQNADVHNVLRLLAEVSGLNIVAGEDVTGKITLKLNKVPWDQVLDLVTAANGLGMVKNGNVVRIAPLAKLKEENQYLSGLQQTEPLMTEYIQVNYAKASVLKEQLEKMRSERGTVTADDRTNKLILKDTQSVIENAKVVVRSLDEPTKQVLIEARIVEASTDFSRGLGVQWGSGSASNILSDTAGGWALGMQGQLGSNFAVSPGLPSTPYGALGFTFGHLSTPLINLDVRLLAMENDGKGQIISSPRITTLDNKEAYIQQGSKVPYTKQTQDGISTEFTEATLKLTVVPHITPDNRISLSIMAKKDEPDWTRQDRNGTPAINTKEAKTELLINNGDTVVIGGIIYEKNQHSVHGIPGLHKVPVFGWLFKGETDSQERTELLIFLSANTVKLD